MFPHVQQALHDVRYPRVGPACRCRPLSISNSHRLLGSPLTSIGKFFKKTCWHTHMLDDGFVRHAACRHRLICFRAAVLRSEAACGLALCKAFQALKHSTECNCHEPNTPPCAMRKLMYSALGGRPAQGQQAACQQRLLEPIYTCVKTAAEASFLEQCSVAHACLPHTLLHLHLGNARLLMHERCTGTRSVPEMIATGQHAD